MGNGFWHLSEINVDRAVAGVIFLAYFLAAVFVWLFWKRILRRFAWYRDHEQIASLLTSVRRLFVLGLLLVGFNTTLDSLLPSEKQAHLLFQLNRLTITLIVIVSLLAILRLINVATTWYVHRAAERLDHPRDIADQAALARKTISAISYVIGLLYILRTFGVDTSPVLASGAIGGLAVAWAFQDTLSNLFAGYFLTIDNSIKVGDSVRLATGEEGVVEQVTWRNTQIVTSLQTMVIVPNAKLSQATLLNYSMPRRPVLVRIPCRVALDSDMKRIEAITREVAVQVQQTVTGADAAWEPLIRWREFTDYALSFIIVLRIHDYEDQVRIQSECIKALQTRYRAEGIAIPVPAQTVRLAPPEAEEDERSRNGADGNKRATFVTRKTGEE